MCHCPIGGTFTKVAFHMTLHNWFGFHESESATCEALIHQDNIFRVLVYVSILGLWSTFETPFHINRGFSPIHFSL